jgi:hypothetical protein
VFNPIVIGCSGVKGIYGSKIFEIVYAFETQQHPIANG